MSTKNRLFIPGYKRLEYIESTGTQYIDTGFNPDSNTKVEVRFKSTNVSVTRALIGARNVSSGDRKAFIIWDHVTSAMRWDYGQTGSVGQGDKSTTEWNVAVKNKTGNTLNNVALSSNNEETFACSYPLALFGVNTGGSVSSFSSCAVSVCRIWDNGTLVRDFIPVQRISDNAIGMYDTVTKTFYRNAGTGVFTAGPELRQIEWLESTGVQYLDTGLIYGKFIHDIQFNRTNTRQLMGTNGSAANFWGMNSGNTGFDFGAYSISYSPLDRNIVEYTRFENENGVLTVKDKTVTAVPTSTPRVNYMLLGGLGTEYNCFAKVYSLKIYNSSNTIVRDFIPVLVGTEYAMFDLVTNTVYRNAGTGVFSGGPLVPDPAFMPFTSMRLSRYANATSADTAKYPQTLNGRKTVDLGTPTWTYDATNGRFMSSKIADMNPLRTNGYIYGYTPFNTAPGTSSPDRTFCLYPYGDNNPVIFIKDTRYTNAASFREAMTGLPLLYQLATSDGSVWNFTCDTATKTKNLVDFNETRITSSTWATADKSKGFEIIADIYGKSVGNSLGTNANCFGVFAPCKKGESVSIDFFNYAPYYGRCLYCEVDANFKVLTTPVQYSNGTSALTQKTFTATNDNCIGFAIEWYIATAQTRDYTKENYMVVRGTTVPTAYEPYGNIFGYRNQATGEFVKAFGATGTITSYNKIDFLSAIFKGRVPAGYQEVEYIESTGIQYIDTGIIPSATQKWEITIKDTGAVGKNYMGRIATTRCSIVTFTSGNKVGTIVQGTTNVQATTFDHDKHTYTLDMPNMKFNADGTDYTISGTIGTLPNYDIIIFSDSTAGSAFTGDVYSARIWDNGTLIRDFIPVKKISNNEYGMYDMVTKQFFGNGGTGTFTGGPAVKPKLITFTNDYYNA